MGVYYKKHLILAPCTFTLYTRVFPSAVHGCNLLVLDMVMLKPKLALAPPAFTLKHMSVPRCCGSLSIGQLVSSNEYGGAKINIYTSTTCFHTEHT